MEFIQISANSTILNLIEENIGAEEFNRIKNKLNKIATEELNLIDGNLVAYTDLTNKFVQQMDKSEILTLPIYEKHKREVIMVDDTNLLSSIEDINKVRYLGFDTESKPVFRRGQPKSKISLMQIATTEKCYIFQMAKITDRDSIGELIENKNLLKIGIGLGEDINKLKNELGYKLNSIVDLSSLFRCFGRKNRIGTKQLVALVLNENIKKSKKMSTSNWATKKLSHSQIIYASDDAFSSVDAYIKLREILLPYKNYMNSKLLKMLDY